MNFYIERFFKSKELARSAIVRFVGYFFQLHKFSYRFISIFPTLNIKVKKHRNRSKKVQGVSRRGGLELTYLKQCDV